MNTFDLDAPQLGEHAWHAFTGDPNIATESLAHRDRIEAVVAAHQPALDWSRARVLEVGAYRHYTGHLLAAQRGAECFVTDIAAAALRDGRAQAQAQDLAGTARMVVADFHDLPFTTGCFDIVYVAASVHHTRRPELVLREMLRVLQPGGLLIVANEPCARVCCFHAFACNRADSLTPYETTLNDAGLLPTLSSPFWGTRPEVLFGMVENDRIPLALYMDVLTREGTIVERTLTEHALVGAFERQLLALRSTGNVLRDDVRALLAGAVARAAAGFGETERLLEYQLPTECQIHALAGHVARLLAQRPDPAREDEWRAELFGAALSVVVRKHGAPDRRGARVLPPAFRREMNHAEDGLVTERSGGGQLAGGLALPLLPDLHACTSGDVLEPWFPKEDWQWVNAVNGERSMANLSALARIEIAPRAARTLLLLRYFAVVTDRQPYRVRIWGGGRLLDEQLVVLQESRLVRAWLPEECAELLVELVALDEAKMDYPWRLRIGVFQLFA